MNKTTSYPKTCLLLAIILGLLLSLQRNHASASTVDSFPAPLRVLIGIPETASGIRYVGDGNGIVFPVIIENVPNTPVNIWAPACSYGYSIVSLEVTRVDGKTLPAPLEVQRFAAVWLSNGPISETVEPREAIVRNVRIGTPDGPANQGVGHEYFGMPLPKSYGGSRELALRAVLTIPPSNLEVSAPALGVWTGTIKSPLHDYVITRQEYGNSYEDF